MYMSIYTAEFLRWHERSWKAKSKRYFFHETNQTERIKIMNSLTSVSLKSRSTKTSICLLQTEKKCEDHLGDKRQSSNVKKKNIMQHILWKFWKFQLLKKRVNRERGCLHGGRKILDWGGSTFCWVYLQKCNLKCTYQCIYHESTNFGGTAILRGHPSHAKI